MASAPTDLQALAQKLLTGDFDINLLDQIVGAAYDPISPHRAQANKALMQLQESPELWRMADTIIEQSKNPNSRFFGLQVLDDAIKIRYVENEFCVGKVSLASCELCWNSTTFIDNMAHLFSMYSMQSNKDGR